MITQALRDTGAPLGAQACWWEEQIDGLEAHVCDDGRVILWRDDQYNVWLPQERPPARWRKNFRHHRATEPFLGAFGEATPAGVCTRHKPVPLTRVRRLQKALRSLAGRVHDNTLRVTADGLVGTHTVNATNRAMAMYVMQPAELATGQLTHSQVASFAAQLAAYIDKAPHARATPSAAQSAPTAATASTPPTQSQGAPMPAYYADDPGYPPQRATYYPPPRPAYYPPPSYGPPYGPGGLPADRASLDVKAFVPAQYEHIRLDPATGLLLVGVGFMAVMLVLNKKKEKG